MNISKKQAPKLIRLCCIALLIVLGLASSVQSETVSENDSARKQAEYQVKALFLYNFANFVEWPKGAFKTRDEAIKLCLFGAVPFGGFLDAVDGTLIGDRELNIARTQNIEEIRSGCHILFVGEDQQVQLPTFWDEIRFVYVLSIGEEQGFTERGGIVNIMRTTDQVQFEINISNALEKGLFISSDVLSLARAIKRNTEASDESP